MNLVKLKVNAGNQKYSILVGKNILNKLKKFLIESSINSNQYLVVADKNVPKRLINKVIDDLQYQQPA